ncbi:tail protein [Podophage Lau218]|uniref:Phage tail protein n=2 Tax=Lauvirus lau218 TaxID=1465639 RepID=A0A060BKX5_9CAUD|nr:tail protein [Podophage Lau218]AIA83154.1 phage tail protein [Podophage Lau218]AIA83202.1 phage tail protein [Lauvirus lau218]AIA83252.1 phage tail protein [Lauvirus lau218]
MEVNQTLPTLANGISQQAVHLRNDSFVEEMFDCNVSLVEGITVRAGEDTVIMDAWPVINDNNGNPVDINQGLLWTHTYDTGTGFGDDASKREVHIQVSTTGAWRVYLFSGDLTIPDTFSYGWDEYFYIFDVPSDMPPYSAVSVGDSTFITNRLRTVTKSSVWAHTGHVHKDHSFYWVKRSLLSYGGTDNSDIRNYRYTINTIDIPTSYSSAYGDTDVVAYSLANAGGVGFEVSGSVVYRDDIVAGSSDWVTGDSWGNMASVGWQGRVSKLQDLPNNMGSFYGTKTIVEVTGDEDNEFTGFWAWVENEGDNWSETIEPGISSGLDKSSMPHVFRNVDDGSTHGVFEVQEFEWNDREVGGDESNAMPTIVGGVVRDIFFFKNRLGLLTKNGVVLSEVGLYENLFRTTVTDLLDSDPIDISIDTNIVSDLHYAIPYNNNLLIFGAREQYILSGAKTLTPKNVSVTQSTKYDYNTIIPPVALGANVYFTVNKGFYLQVREYYNVDGTASNESTDITEQVPRLIPNDSELTMVGSEKHDMLFIANDDLTFVYNMAWGSEGKVQSAWHLWTVGGYLTHANASLHMFRRGYPIDGSGNEITTDDFGVGTGELDLSTDIFLGHNPFRIFGDSNYDTWMFPYIGLSEWGFKSGSYEVDDKTGKLQIRKITLFGDSNAHIFIKEKGLSVADPSIAVIENTKTATVMRDSKETSIGIMPVDGEEFSITSINLSGRFNKRAGRAI